MKKLSMLAMAVFLSCASTQTFATTNLFCAWFPYLCQSSDHYSTWEHTSGHCEHGGGGTTPGEVTKVPEIDAAGTGLAFALVSGLMLIMRERRKSKKA